MEVGTSGDCESGDEKLGEMLEKRTRYGCVIHRYKVVGQPGTLAVANDTTVDRGSRFFIFCGGGAQEWSRSTSRTQRWDDVNLSCPASPPGISLFA
jgi:hypothetical protein